MLIAHTSVCASTMHTAMAQRFVFEGQPTSFTDGDTIAIAAVRNSEHPGNGGTLCLSGDCGNCVAEVNGIAFVRTCQVVAQPGMLVARHPAVGTPSLFGAPAPDRRTTEDAPVEHLHVDVAVIGGRSTSGAAEADRLRAEGHNVVELDALDGNEVVAIYSGPLVIARTPSGFTHVHAHEVVVATGAAEIFASVPGSTLPGIVTGRAFEKLLAAGVELERTVCVGTPPDGFTGIVAMGDLVRFEGTDQVESVVVKAANGTVHRHHCDTAVVGLGLASRDLLSRMAGTDAHVRVVGPAGESFPLPPEPTDGVVCGCSKTTVEDLQGVWDRGFQEVELIKRASLCGTGTCQGGRVSSSSHGLCGSAEPMGRRCPLRRDRQVANSRWAKRPREFMSTRGVEHHCTMSTSNSGPTWTGSARGGGRGTTAITSPSTGPSAKASPSET